MGHICEIYLGDTGFDACERWEEEKVDKITFKFHS